LYPNRNMSGNGDEVLLADSTHFIGEHYGGGIIVFLDSSLKHGLIAAPTDLKDFAAWGTMGLQTNADGPRSGRKNTKLIVQATGTEANYAALLCAKYQSDGFTDWYLPALVELYVLYGAKDIVGMNSSSYWSSTESMADYAWYVLFPTGGATAVPKSAPFSVRPVRRF
jgi:hypothetical protein